jgi:hypothetical protein
MRKFIFLAILTLILVLPEAQAISFGSLQTVKNIDLLPYQEKKVKILVWNSGEEEFYLNFNVINSLKGIEVEIFPNSFLLTKNPTGDVEIVNVGKKIFRAKVVNVDFKATENAESGEIIITALTKAGTQGGISVSQTRDFKFLININKVSRNEANSEKNLQNLPISTKITFSPESIIFVLAAVLILLISFLIYKFS